MFFSVKKSMRIAGKVYTPCVCYPLPRFLELTVQKLSEKEEAVIYDHMVFFQNGKVIENKKEEPEVKAKVTPVKVKKQKKEAVEEEKPSVEDKDFEDF